MLRSKLGGSMATLSEEREGGGKGGRVFQPRALSTRSNKSEAAERSKLPVLMLSTSASLGIILDNSVLGKIQESRGDKKTKWQEGDAEDPGTRISRKAPSEDKRSDESRTRTQSESENESESEEAGEGNKKSQRRKKSRPQ
jgi:hypothetical protein